jgi:hypothetical protein
MVRTILLLVGGLAAGLAISWAWQGESPVAPPFERGAPEHGAAPRSSGPGGAEVERLAALEAGLAEETSRREELEARVAELVAALESRPPAAAAGPGAEGPGPDPAAVAQARERFRRNGPEAAADASQRLIDRLVAGGFPPDRAEWINRRTQELRMAALEAQYEARREGRALDAVAALGGDRALRTELGDADYERYLAALNRPTSATVAEVLASSPAERAGLKPGDEVLSYGGTRVFDMRDLNALTFEGATGESVVVEVRRAGQTIQLVVPRGPMGVTVGNFARPRGP